MALVKFGSTKEEQTRLANLVLLGKKTATSSLVSLQRIKELPPTQVGDIWGILNGEDSGICTVKVTQVEQRNWENIGEAFAKDEGDDSLQQWTFIHEPYYRSLLKEYYLTLLPSTLLECVYFELIE